MKIKVRKIVEEERKEINPITKKPYKYTVQYENGFVEELDIDFRDITALSFDKSLRFVVYAIFSRTPSLIWVLALSKVG